MKLGHKKMALLGTALVALLLAGQVLASGLDGASQPDASVHSCRYYYWLEEDTGESEEGGTGNSWRYNLYVARTDPEGYLLHTGYISLAAQADTLSFAPAEGWELLAEPENGTFEDSRYLSFGWYWTGGETGKPLEESKHGDTMQKLGVVTITGTAQPELEDIELLEWYNTQTGSRQVADWQAAAAQAAAGDTNVFPEDFLEIIDRTWRFAEPTSLWGYYQGYYDPTEDWTGETLPREDLTPGWQGFRIGAYAPQRPITLTFQKPETGEVLAVAVNPGKDSGTGHFKTRIDFGSLTYTDKDGQALEGGLPDGTYTLVVSKLSHVTCTIPDVTFESGVCTELLGVYIELPCGDVDRDGDIKQDDRAKLTAPGMYRSKRSADEAQGTDQEACDLDGDQRVDQTDLAILIAPANYGKQNFTYLRR